MTIISAWWRLNLRFKDPVGDRVGVELLFNSVEFGVPEQLPADFQTVETRCGREDHTRPRGPSESTDGVDLNIRRTIKTQRDGHNSGVKIWSLCSVFSTLSHANPWTTLSSPCNKVRGKYVVKEVFVRLPSCVLPSGVFPLASLSLCRCELFYIYMCMYVDVNLHIWLYNTRSGFELVSTSPFLKSVTITPRAPPED